VSDAGGSIAATRGVGVADIATQGLTMRVARNWSSSCARLTIGRRSCGVTWLVAAACAGVWATPAPAADRPIACDNFCNPVAADRLDTQRGQGFETSVILWDELNRRRAAPPPPPPPAGNQGPMDSSIVRLGPIAVPNAVLIGAGR
jgi:hypothetical protein